MHKWLAKELLLRKNPYRGDLTLVEDPAVAMIELSNENSFFMGGADDVLSGLPEPYISKYHTNFSAWLKAKYDTTENLRVAWAPTHPEECSASLTSRVCVKREGAEDLITTKIANWRFTKSTTTTATVTDNEDGSITVDVGTTSETDWHLMLSHGNIELDENKAYVVEFYAKSLGANRPLGCIITMNESPYSQLSS